MSDKKNTKKTDSEKIVKKTGLNKSYSFSRVSALDVALSIRHLSIMLKSSMSIADAIRVLSGQGTSEKLQETFAEIHTDVQAGKNLADAMAKHPKVFTHVVVSVIRVGEAAGTLEKNLIFLAEFLKKNYELNRKVKGALIYPMIVFGITVLEMLGVVFFILPKLESLFNSFENKQALTVFVMSATGVIRAEWPYFLLGIIVFTILFRLFLRTKIGISYFDRFMLGFPVIKKLTQKHTLTNFSRTLGILMESSIPITEALRISADTVENGIYRRALLDIQAEVSSGKNLSEAMEKYEKLFPSTYVKMLEIGESTGSLEDNLLYLHEFYAEEVEEMSNNLATLLEPILLVFIGLMIGLLALTIIGPIYQLTSNINT